LLFIVTGSSLTSSISRSS